MTVVGFKVKYDPTTGLKFASAAPANNAQSRLLSIAKSDDLLVLLLGRLYYQDDLRSKCRQWLDPKDPGCADAALALAAYRAGVIEKLEGDFAVVIWDARKQLFIALRDPLGGFPLFWGINQESVSVSTSLTALAKSLPKSSLNRDYLAEYLAFPSYRDEIGSEICAYNGVQRVLPGTSVTICVSSKKVDSNNFWKWSDRIVAPKESDLLGASIQFKEVLQASVRERLVGRTISHLSGGMDSTTIALLGRDLVCSGFGERPLHTISLIYSRLPGLAQETSYVEEVLQNETEIAAHRLIADNILNFDGIETAPRHEEPYPGLWSLEVDRAIFDIASKNEIVTVLTGRGADYLLENTPYNIANFLRRGDIRRALLEAKAWRPDGFRDQWNILRAYGLAPLATRWRIAEYWRKMRLSHSQHLRDQKHWSLPPWILSSFNARYGMVQRSHSGTRQAFMHSENVDLSTCIQAVRNLAGEAVKWSAALPLGIHSAHPFLDPRLIALALGIKQTVRLPAQQPKPVLVEAMRNRLPKRILDRKNKWHFDETYYLGLSRNRSSLERMIADAPIENLEIFDKKILSQTLQEICIGGVNATHLLRFDASISLIKWLTMHEIWLRESTALDREELVNFSVRP